MRQSVALSYEFVKAIPDKLKDGTLCVSIDYATAAHKCCCGCGREVVTPLSPTDWKLTYDGVSVSLFPSIGNWSFECRSHYWIDRNTVKWAEQWSEERIAAGRAHDRRLKQGYDGDAPGKKAGIAGHGKAARGKQGGIWSWLRRWW